MIRIRVTEEHIKKGCRRDGETCPVFLAMRDTGIPVTWVMIGYWTTHPDRSLAPWWARYDLPAVATKFIETYDRNKHVDPIEFEVEYSPLDDPASESI